MVLCAACLVLAGLGCGTPTPPPADVVAKIAADEAARRVAHAGATNGAPDSAAASATAGAAQPGAGVAAEAAAVATNAAAAPSDAPPARAVRSADDANAALLRQQTAAAGAYRIAAGDEVEIEVLGEPDISRTFRVAGDGTIRHPLLGVTPVAGRTAVALEQEFTAVLDRDYLVNPRVYVRLKQSAARRVMVFGEVRKPGVYHLLPNERFTLLSVLARAGGFTEIADINRVRIVREQGDDGEADGGLRVRVSDLLSGRGEDTDVPLRSEDVINVPETLF